MLIFWVFTVCGGFTRSMVIFQKLFSQCNNNMFYSVIESKFKKIYYRNNLNANYRSSVF